MNLDGYSPSQLRRMADAYERMAPTFLPNEYTVDHCNISADLCRRRAAAMDGQPYDTPTDWPLDPPITGRGVVSPNPAPAAPAATQGRLEGI